MTTTRSWLLATGLVAGASIGATAVATHPNASRWMPGVFAGAADTSSIDPDAVGALNKMAEYLRTLKTMQVTANVTTEEVDENGQKVQELKEIDLLAQRPNKLRVVVQNDRKPRVMLYDGKTFTLWAPRTNFYAQANAPGTIVELADTLEDRFNIELPLVDLFRWGTPESGFKDLTAAADAGPAMIDGSLCEQYTFRQPGLDWQIWIQQGDYPLPRRIAVTTTTDDARPQYVSQWKWNLAPAFDDEQFAWSPPDGAKKIPFVDYQKLGADVTAKEGK